MGQTPIAICYLFTNGDEKNKCLLFKDEFRIVKDGREHVYPTDNGINFHFTHKKWMFPFVTGWIVFCASLLFIFRNQFNPWISLSILISSFFAIYVGWEGSEMLNINTGSVTHLFPVKKATNNLKLFVRFVQNYLSPLENEEGRLAIYHITKNESWLSQESDPVYSHESLSDEGFIHCSLANQVSATFDKYFASDKDLILLVINPLMLTNPLKLENAAQHDQLFPHIYGQINKEAILHHQKFDSLQELSELLKNNWYPHPENFATLDGLRLYEIKGKQ